MISKNVDLHERYLLNIKTHFAEQRKKLNKTRTEELQLLLFGAILQEVASSHLSIEKWAI